MVVCRRVEPRWSVRTHADCVCGQCVLAVLRTGAPNARRAQSHGPLRPQCGPLQPHPSALGHDRARAGLVQSQRARISDWSQPHRLGWAKPSLSHSRAMRAFASCLGGRHPHLAASLAPRSSRAGCPGSTPLGTDCNAFAHRGQFQSAPTFLERSCLPRCKPRHDAHRSRFCSMGLVARLAGRWQHLGQLRHPRLGSTRSLVANDLHPKGRDRNVGRCTRLGIAANGLAIASQGSKPKSIQFGSHSGRHPFLPAWSGDTNASRSVCAGLSRIPVGSPPDPSFGAGRLTLAHAKKDARMKPWCEPMTRFGASKPPKALVRAEHVVFLQGENHV
ncbi:MAG: hypothetical protein RL307_375 [Pseudomonadota bacterium]